MELHRTNCVECGSNSVKVLSYYDTKSNGRRSLYKCSDCKACFSETKLTFLQNLKTPISKIATVLNTRTEGLSFNSTCRAHHISPHTLQNWEKKFGSLKETLMLYSLTQSFLSLTIEGDELYTRVNKNGSSAESVGNLRACGCSARNPSKECSSTPPHYA